MHFLVIGYFFWGWGFYLSVTCLVGIAGSGGVNIFGGFSRPLFPCAYASSP